MASRNLALGRLEKVVLLEGYQPPALDEHHVAVSKILRTDAGKIIKLTTYPSGCSFP
jgi:hypothetical protein